MATIKSYTDLEQSKKLAEILPFESADMFWLVLGNTPRVHVLTEPLSNYSNWENYPCWSLAALLGFLPDVHLKKYIYDGITKYYATLIGIRQFNSEHYDNPIDACYDMIIHLYELNLL